MAEGKLREATKKAEYGKLGKFKKGEYDSQRVGMQDELDKKDKKKTELEQMRSDVQELRKKVKDKGGDAEADKTLADLEAELDELEKEGKTGENDEMKAEIERLRQVIDNMESSEDGTGKRPSHQLPQDKERKEYMRDVKMQDLESGKSTDGAGGAAAGGAGGGAVGGAGGVEELGAETGKQVGAVDTEVTPVESKGIDIDTQMPFGELEPFGREDTAQELTESSVHESDMMVDQLERAEVAEEKRAVFRALTRLRGAAITSFDGVARAQTGNIDEYNKTHKWRKTHPLHHLADEESDITKWAFPDNADFIQKTGSMLQQEPGGIEY